MNLKVYNPVGVYPTRVIYYNYKPISKSYGKYKNVSIKPLGFDTEAYTNGRCFMIATSLGDAYPYSDFPACMFNRKYKNATFCTYNLSYDEGAIVQFLPKQKLIELREKQTVSYNEYVIKYIPKKFLRITRNKKDSITFFDMFNFYHHSAPGGKSDLNSVAAHYLHDQKIDIGTKSFSKEYVQENWSQIANYCIQDAVLVDRLAALIIKEFELFDVYPRALYSTAYITYQYFSKKTNYVTVKRFWDDHKKLLDYAILSYNGGKFEVTTKGSGMLYDYDIVSAYPDEISKLYDISHADIVYSKRYEHAATYGFIYAAINIPINVNSPVAWKWGSANIYPVGLYSKVITKTEYDYLKKYGCDLKIIDAVWIMCTSDKQPYREEVLKLVEYKKQYKAQGDYLRTHTVKILLNSLYGKFVQKIKKPEGWECSSCWNPIYGSIITANTRTKITEMQQLYKSIIAVHTDSIISTEPLPLTTGKNLGDWAFEAQGEGVVLGCGIYQIADLSKIRGFRTSRKLIDVIKNQGYKISLTDKHSISWREVIFHNWSVELINQFKDVTKYITVDFDRKRIWLNDYKSFGEALERKVHSLPHVIGKYEV
jgi:hypothetical protein